jgi:two-component system sensor histidine kinase KdpD
MLTELSKPKRPYQHFPWSYLLALSAVALITGLIYLVDPHAGIADVSMLYLLMVIIAALLLSSEAAIAAGIAGFLATDWFFVEPRYEFTVQYPSEWVALMVFLITAMITGQLTAMLRKRAEEAQLGKQQILALAEASWAIASELDFNRAMAKILNQLGTIGEVKSAALIAPDQTEALQLIAQFPPEELLGAKCNYSPDAVKFVLDRGLPINWETDEHFRKALSTSEEPNAIYLPIQMDDNILGVLYLVLANKRALASEQKQFIDSLVNHAAVVLQKDKYLKAEAKAQALIEADRLKTALLSMISHDFRSPLTSIKASVSSLIQEGRWDTETRESLLQTIDQETDRLNRMVGNILDLSKLEAGAWSPRREPTAIAELVGATLDTFSDLENKRIIANVENNAEEVSIDFVQIVQVLHNLLENALKYSSEDKTVELKSYKQASSLVIDILDRGSGLPKGEEKRIFEPFYRAEKHQESSTPGLGIGLAICHGLVEAHQGSLVAYNRDGGGALFRVILDLP